MTQPYYQDEAVTLYHGDCLEIDEWLAADVLVTDPPYGIAGGRIGSHRRHRSVSVDWDNLSARDAALEQWGRRPYAVFGSPRVPPIEHVEIPLVWDKGASPGMGRIDWPWGPSYELIYVNGIGWRGRRAASVIHVRHGSTKAKSIGHPTPKPVQLMEHLIERAPDGVIADPFAGSGSTLLAARNLGRRAIGVELEERYCEIIARRLSQGVLL